MLTEIHKIMLQDACTKDVLREMDGFLVLMSVLSTIHPTFSQETRAEAAGPELLESTRLVFMILSEALHKHNENVQYFKVRVFTGGTPSCPEFPTSLHPRRPKSARNRSRKRPLDLFPTRAPSSRR